MLGAALAYRELFADPQAAEIATITKLTRNTMLIMVIPGAALLYRRGLRRTDAELPAGALVPLFVLGFSAMSVARSLGDWVVAREAASAEAGALWQRIVAVLGDSVSGLALATALAALGFSTRLGIFRNLGWRPFWLGLCAAASVSAAGLAAAWMLERLLV